MNTSAPAPASTAAPSGLEWSDDLLTGDARTDHTHQEFVDLVNATTAAAPADKLIVYQQLVAHTIEHFGQEERWMLACGISPDFCHFSQHKNVLDVMKEVERRALAGETEYIGSMIEALVEWFPGHANSMDAGLVAFLQEKGYDTSAEAFHAGPPKAGEAGEAATLACTHHAPGESCA